MPRPLQYLGQFGVYALIALILGTFASYPSYRPHAAGQAQVILSFSHSGRHKGECRKLTQEEIAEMAKNMRRSELCPRERYPIFVELRLSGETVLSEWVPPTGLASDGASQVYQRLAVTPGQHLLEVRMADSGSNQSFDYARSATIDLAPGQNFVIDFQLDKGGFSFPGNET